MRRITIRDVAAAAGVSVSTVSNAFNRPEYVSTKLRETVLNRAKELGYLGGAPSARSLRSGRTGALGVLFAQRLPYAFTDPYAVELLRGVSDAAEEAGYSILLVSARDSDEQPTEERVQTAAIDALVSTTPLDSPAAQRAVDRGLRVVGLASEREGLWVGIDDREAGRLIGRHIAELGHRDVVVMTESGQDPCEGPPPTPEDPSDPAVNPGRCRIYQHRIGGILEELPDARVRFVDAGWNARECGRLIAEQLSADPPSAVIAMSDLLALGCLDALGEADCWGAAAPAQDADPVVSIAGFDDIPQADGAGLTTVAQPIYDKGRRAALLALGHDEEADHRLGVRLIRRRSTGRASA